MAIRGRNPHNPQSDLFKALTRLFSGPIINYRSQSGRRIRRQHLDKFSSRFKTASGQQFKKTLHNPLDVIASNAIANQRRSERYIDFDSMEYMPEIASSMDIYADEMTTYSELRPMLNIKCPNEELRAVLDVLYSNVLNLEYNLFGWCRTMCKYGDFFLYLDVDDNYGVKSAIAIPPQELERLEGMDSTNPNYVQYQWNSAGMTFENWQISHFRILGNDKYAPYGTSVLEPARRIHRQLVLMEDAMMAYRVIRSSERRVFKIDVGAIPPQDVEQYMEKVVSQLKRHSVVDPSTGRVDLRYNPMSIEEDYYIPVRAGSATEIQSLAGAQNITQIDDIKYLRDKLFSALKIPQSYLTLGEGGDEDKATLAQKDIRFARTIQRLQRVVISELTKIGIIHLYTLGFRGDDLLSFSLSLNNPSKIAELQELEHWKTKFDTAASATEGYFSRRWVAERLFNMTHEEFVRNQREMYFDRKHDANLQAVAEAGAQGAAGGGLGLDGGLGDSDLGLPPEDVLDAGPEEMAAVDAGGEAEQALAGDDSALLAVPPGSRSDRRLSPVARKQPHFNKGPNSHSAKKYTPVDVDRRNAGARMRSNASKYAAEKARNTPRTVFPGATSAGAASGVRSLVKMGGITSGIYEAELSTYNLKEHSEEEKLFSIDNSIRSLLENLENQSKITEQEDENTTQ